MPDWKQSPITAEEARRMIELLGSNRSHKEVYWEIYRMFHDGERCRTIGEGTVPVGEFTCTMMYREEDYSVYALYDADKNTQADGFSRHGMTEFMCEYLASLVPDAGQKSRRTPKAKKTSAVDVAVAALKEALINEEIARLKAILTKHKIPF